MHTIHRFLAAVLFTSLLGACAQNPASTADGGYCPAGEERVCRRVSDRADSVGGSRLSSRKVCGCEAVEAL